MELAARRRVQRAGNFTFELDSGFFRVRVEVGNGRQQRLGIGMLGVRKQFFGRRDLDDLTQIHHRDMVAGVGHHGEVVGYEQERQPQFLLQGIQQVEDVRLDRHVERGDTFVGHQKTRIADQRPGDRDALALAAREGMRKPPQMLQIQAAFGGDLAHPLIGFLARRGETHHFERLGDDVANRHSRAERGVGVLEDELAAPAIILELGLRQMVQVVLDPVIAEPDVTARQRVDVEQRPAKRRLAGAGFPDQAEKRAGGNIDRYVIHRTDVFFRSEQLSADGKMHREFADGYQGFVGHAEVSAFGVTARQET